MSPTALCLLGEERDEMLLPYESYICTIFGAAKFIESAPTKEVDATLGFCKASLLKSHQF